MKIFHAMQSKFSSSGVRRRKMARRGAAWSGMVCCLPWTGDNLEMGWGAMSLGWSGWGADCDHGICAPLPLLSCPRKFRNGNRERGCKGKLIQKKSSLCGWRGVPSYKRAGVNNNFKSGNLLLKRKVYIYSKYAVSFIATTFPYPMQHNFILTTPSLFCYDIELSVIKVTQFFNLDKNNNYKGRPST